MFHHFFTINHYFLRFLWLGYNFGLLFYLKYFFQLFLAKHLTQIFFSHNLNFVVSCLFRDEVAFFTHYSLLINFSLLLIIVFTCYQLLFCLLLIALLLITHCIFTCYSLCFTHYSLLVVFFSLLVPFYSLP